MGTDCCLKTSEGRNELDRWYVFDKEFESGEEYSQDEALAKIEALKLASDFPEYRSDYHGYWISFAEDKIKGHKGKSGIIFYNEHDGGYYENEMD